MIITRDEIVEASERIGTKRPCWCRDPACGISYHAQGLCEAFNGPGVAQFLRALGGEATDGYFWPLTAVGRTQRLTFLAFMLAWHDDITGRP